MIWERFEAALRSILSIVAGALIAAIAIICFIEVVRRPFGGSFSWYDEFVGYLLVWLTFVGAALARLHHQHIGLENLLERLPPRGRLSVELAGHGLMIGVHVVLLIHGGELVVRFLSERAITLDVPMGLIYAVIPLSAALMLVVEAIRIRRLIHPAGDSR